MSSPAGHAIFEAVRASLRLVNSSSGLFTIPQLLAIEGDLRETLAVISGKVQAEQSGMSTRGLVKCLTTHSCFTGGGRTIIDCESSSDEEKEDQKEDIRAASGDFPDPALVRRRSLTGITGSDGGSEPPRALGFLLSNVPVQALIFSPISPDPRPLCDNSTQDRQATRLLVCR